MEKLNNEIYHYVSDTNVADHKIRVADVFYITQKYLTGNCIEIGAGNGDTTRLLLQRSYQSKIVVVDPYEKINEFVHDSYVQPYSLENLISSTLDWKENLIVIKKSSNDPNIRQILNQYSPIIFSFVDGLQKVNDVLYDLETMKNLNVPVIAIDDYNRLTNISEVPIAVEEFIKINKDYKSIYNKDNREIYLVKI